MMGMVENGPGTVVLGAADGASALAAIKARLRVASGDEDPLIVAFAESALGLAERFIGQASIARAMRETVAAHGGWQRLSARPVRTIDAVTRGAVPLAAGDYAVDIDGDGIGWVRAGSGSGAGAAVTVSYSAGLATGWTTLPAGLREGAALLAGHLFDDRTGERPVPGAVSALWRPFRVMRLSAEIRS